MKISFPRSHSPHFSYSVDTWLMGTVSSEYRTLGSPQKILLDVPLQIVREEVCYGESAQSTHITHTRVLPAWGNLACCRPCSPFLSHPAQPRSWWHFPGSLPSLSFPWLPPQEKRKHTGSHILCLAQPTALHNQVAISPLVWH